MNCQRTGCVVTSNWFRENLLRRAGYYLESAWYCSEACLEQGIALRLEKRSHTKEKAATSLFQSKLEHSLVGSGGLTREKMDKAVAESSRNSGERLTRHLVNIGLLKEHDVTLALSRTFSIPVINLNSHRSTPNALNMVPREIVRSHGFFPLDFDATEKRLVLVTYDPASLSVMINLRGILDCQVTIYLADESVVREMIDRYCQLSESLSPSGVIESPGVVRDSRDLARWIVRRAKALKASALKIDCFDRFIWTRFVIGHKPFDLVFTPTYAS